MVQNIIFALMIIFLMAGAFFWMWKLSKWLVIPIQIILFILLMVVVVKVFVNKDNAARLHSELEKSGIAEVEKKSVSNAVSMIKNNVEKQPAASAPVYEQKNNPQPAVPTPAPVSEKKPNQQPASPTKTTPTKNTELNFVDML